MLFDLLTIITGMLSSLLAKVSSWQVGAAKLEIEAHQRQVQRIRHCMLEMEQDLVNEQNEIEYLENYLNSEPVEL